MASGARLFIRGMICIDVRRSVPTSQLSCSAASWTGAWSSRMTMVSSANAMTASRLSLGSQSHHKGVLKTTQLVSSRTASRRCVVVVRAAKKEKSIYSDTVNLPDTKFDMRANSTVKEPALQKFWSDEGIYSQLIEENPGEPFTLHDGPPYANGDLHIGHALNKILKDFINRYHILQGRKVKYVPGWDCHGLPIELKVLQSMDTEERKALTPIKLRQKAAKFAQKTVNEQRKQFMRYGIWGDWEEPYMTLQPEYEAAQMGVFGKMFLNGHIYRGKKPVHWSPSSRTALAEAELEYPEGHTSRSIFVAMPIVTPSEALSADVKATMSSDAALAIWTTTPWTIPANAAVAVNDALVYAVVQVSDPAEGASKFLVVAKDLVGSLASTMGKELTVVAEMSGAALEGTTYRHPLLDRESPVVIGGDYITTASGTGLVHTAPGHGQEDYLTGIKYDLPMYSPVDDAGDFTEEAGEEFQGKNVLGEGNTAVIAALAARGALLKEEEYAHKYPYDWRTKKPTIFRATAQWFASVEGFRGEALDAIKGVSWIPAVGENRITAMTEGRSDWCISRQRTWGVPIPVFYDTTTSEPLMNQETIEHVQGIVREKGTDAWFYMDIKDLLPEQYKHMADTLRKGTDTMDVWFDSGSSWASVVDARDGLQLPADLYLEGSDQHRGWFQSSLLTSVAATGSAPYKQVLTHGFVLDEKGFKMSKSLGNVVDPRLVIDGGKNLKQEPAYGADVLRLWVSSVDYTSDVLIGGNIIKQTFDYYRKVRGTVRYLLGNLCDYKPAEHAVAYDELPAMDKYTLNKLAELVEECKEAYESYQFYRVFQAVNNFNSSYLSTVYLDMAKDRLYIRDSDSFARRSCQTVLDACLQSLMSIVAPILPHMAEDAFQSMPYDTNHKSVFQSGWASAASEWTSLDPTEVALLDAVIQVREKVNKILEKARTDKVIGAGLEAKVVIHAENAELSKRLSAMTTESSAAVDELRYLFIVSEASVVSSSDEVGAICGEYILEGKLGEAEDAAFGNVTVGVVGAKGAKCERCWNYSVHVGDSKEHPTLCERCVPVISSMPNAPTPVAAQ